MEKGLLVSPIRKATKGNFLRSISRRRPPTKWLSRNGTKRDRVLLQRDMINLQALLKAEALGSLSRGFKGVLTKQAQQFKDMVVSIGNGTILRNKANGEEWTGEEIALAASVLEQAAIIAFGVSGVSDLQRMSRSHFQSLMDRSYSRTRYLLGEADGLLNPSLAARNEAILQKLNRVQRATKRMADFHIAKSLELQAAEFRLGISWGEVGLAVGTAIEKRIIIPSRLTTLARTEGSRAIDEGIKESVKASDVVSHMSVVGCKAIEPNIPTYNGIPTCNIENVPVSDVDFVEFHVNHTGAWVASQFNEAGVTGTAV